MTRQNKPFRKVITVQGSSLFPLDMLRYDSAWPRTETDSYKIANNLYQPETFEQRAIELITDEATAPNYRRWESFGWQVLTVINV